MVPYFGITSFQLGPFTVYVWGLFVALGIVGATWFATKWAREVGAEHKVIADRALIMIAAAFLGARILHVFGYDWAYYAQNPLEIVQIWKGGWSSVGGILGGLMAGLWFARKEAKPWQWADIATAGLPLGFACGRIGCFLIHDHPGTLSHSLLAVRYPDGPRHDLGLYESLLMWLLFAIIFTQRKKLQQKTGATALIIAASYALTRIILDFFRAADNRWLGLTPAQWILGLLLLPLCYTAHKFLTSDYDRTKRFL